MLEHARVAGHAARARALGLGPKSLAVEVASNDGYLLQYYMRAGVPVLGIEPARNVALSRRSGARVRTVAEFFDDHTGDAARAEGKTADVMHANNVLAHVADLNGFVAGIRELLATRAWWSASRPTSSLSSSGSSSTPSITSISTTTR